jgi:hypothetical protein
MIMPCDKWVPVTSAWRAALPRMEERPPLCESIESIEKAMAGSREGVVLQIRGWV